MQWPLILFFSCCDLAFQTSLTSDMTQQLSESIKKVSGRKCKKVNCECERSQPAIENQKSRMKEFSVLLDTSKMIANTRQASYKKRCFTGWHIPKALAGKTPTFWSRDMCARVTRHTGSIHVTYPRDTT